VTQVAEGAAFVGFLAASVRVATPLLLAAIGETVTERAGVINLGHANHPAVLSCFDQLLELIRNRNLTPVTLDEMFGTSRATG